MIKFGAGDLYRKFCDEFNFGVFQSIINRRFALNGTWTLLVFLKTAS
jgi:hypothetical protein